MSWKPEGDPEDEKDSKCPNCRRTRMILIAVTLLISAYVIMTGGYSPK